MKYLNTYSNFISEKFTPQETDPPEQVSGMNNFNDIEKWFLEFNSKKSALQNIYMNYKTEEDLVKTLQSQKYINSKNLKLMKFNNPLLGMWAKSCEIRREVNDIQNGIGELNKTVKNDTDNMNANPTTAESSKQSIDLKKQDLTNKQKQLQEKNLELANQEKRTKDELKKMMDNNKKSKTQINMYNDDNSQK
jgi:hypothetical protein